MSLTSTAPTFVRQPPASSVRVAPELALETDHSPQEAAEEHRWLLMLVPPFVISAVLFAVVIATGMLWLMGPVLVIGPGLIILGFVYLGLTSDANDVA